MNRKILTIILAAILIASFFLPLRSAGSGSAFDVVKGPSYGSDVEMMLMKYLWILIPVSGVILLIGALNNEQYAFGRTVWTLLPLLVVLYIIVRPIVDGAKIGDAVKNFGVGFWVMLAASLVLAVFHPKK